MRESEFEGHSLGMTPPATPNATNVVVLQESVMSELHQQQQVLQTLSSELSTARVEAQRNHQQLFDALSGGSPTREREGEQERGLE